MKSEHQIQDEIRIALSKHGCTIFRSNAGQVTTIEGRQFYGMPKGFPDLCGHRNSDGKSIYIEVKNEKGKLRPEQIRFGEFLKTQPVLYGVARSVEEALKIVEGSS
ncbi:VRR-NUC domain-containing protein [Enterococcus faecium]|uniref:VRR-NUC domain-containing protein n=1 Tax=Enterococcus TaxID=1350 RepID=UPI001C9A7314|nr:MULTISPECIES: VRR-NUC domain-containing protein [Enterococcus]EMF0559032.1 VRR-NUC domain-containing protein [Enterococcus faecium]MBY7575186.1 VRR-NUC domain-containing protein [Enterococcus faecium]MDR3761364.1 VRR-NUC domain-containing protein [Enterococcus sp.]UNS61652.1 VRR-NUC domain-containing protein [Enterococcus faecium]HAQ4563667.1 VRR-NUC domain-containing protein [Enterococcus faecium]